MAYFHFREPTRATHDDARVKFSKYIITILCVVKFILKNVKSCKHDTHEEYGSLKAAEF